MAVVQLLSITIKKISALRDSNQLTQLLFMTSPQNQTMTMTITASTMSATYLMPILSQRLSTLTMTYMLCNMRAIRLLPIMSQRFSIMICIKRAIQVSNVR